MNLYQIRQMLIEQELEKLYRRYLRQDLLIQIDEDEQHRDIIREIHWTDFLYRSQFHLCWNLGFVLEIKERYRQNMILLLEQVKRVPVFLYIKIYELVFESYENYYDRKTETDLLGVGLNDYIRWDPKTQDLRIIE